MKTKKQTNYLDSRTKEEKKNEPIGSTCDDTVFIEGKTQTKNWEKDFRMYLELKFEGILARKKWNKADIEDIFECLNEQIITETLKMIVKEMPDMLHWYAKYLLDNPKADWVDRRAMKNKITEDLNSKINQL